MKIFIIYLFNSKLLKKKKKKKKKKKIHLNLGIVNL